MKKDENGQMALEDLVILDLTRVLAGPFCTMMLADLGARVIKIEIPGTGDDTRQYPPFRQLKNGRESLYFANINRNKRGVTLNLKTEKGREIFKKLALRADVVIENYRPGVMEKLGLGYEEVLQKLNPRLIYAAISGFGSYGPYKNRPGYDILAQAMGGMMAITGPAGGGPTRAGSALGDILGGLHGAIGILAAIHARTRTGKGQRVDISLMDCVIAATENTAIKYLESGVIPPRMGNRYASVSPYDAFCCRDGMLIIAAGNQKLFEKLCRDILKRPELIADARFTDMPGRLKNQDDLQKIIEDFLKDYTVAEAEKLLLENGIPAGPILDISQILENEQVKAREMFQEMDHPTLGRMTVNGCAVKLADTRPRIRRAAPALGQDNEEVFGALGYGREAILALAGEKII